MKHHILFVDDEPLVIQGLQRMLRPLRTEWEMEFVTNGAEALERMAQASFDVLVADMSMPGMTGPELLNEVLMRHPQTVRLIFSGHADEELIMKCAGITHQYVSKPCDAEALKAAVNRALAVSLSLNSPQFEELTCNADRLTRVAALYMRMVKQPRISDVDPNGCATEFLR